MMELKRRDALAVPTVLAAPATLLDETLLSLPPPLPEVPQPRVQSSLATYRGGICAPARWPF